MMRRLVILTTAILAFSMGGALASAAEGEHHGNEGKKGPAVKEEGHGPVVRDEGHGLHVPPKDIPHEGGVSIFGGKEHRPDEWRYRHDSGGWWYWAPSNHWMFYDGGSWVDYSSGDASVTVGVPAPVPVSSDPNFSWYNNQWWYWKADHWVFWDHDKWHDGEPGKGPPRREPEHKGEPHKGEHEGPRK